MASSDLGPASERVASAVLEVSGLAVAYAAAEVVQGFDLDVAAGEAVGLRGPSGCGKSTVARAVLGLLPGAGRVTAGWIAVGGRNVARLSRREWRQMRGPRVALAAQEPGQALNPVQRAGDQIAVVLRAHGWGRAAARRRTGQVLEEMGLEAAGRCARAYPHQLSGGQLQRVVLAQALACDPALLIADEPATGLDAATREQILAALRRRVEAGMALLLISHEAAILDGITGRIVKMGSPRRAYASSPQRRRAGPPTAPRNPGPAGAPGPPLAIAREFTAGTSDAKIERESRQIPQGDSLPGKRRPSEARSEQGEAAGREGREEYTDVPDPARAAENNAMRRSSPRPPLLQARRLTKSYHRGGRTIAALAGVDLDMEPGETVVLMGSSGAGKSTLARCLAGLEHADSGEIRRAGEVGPRGAQLIWQDAAGALNPRMRVGEIIAEPWQIDGGRTGGEKLNRREREWRAGALLTAVGLPAEWIARRPAELSGGEKRRVGIVRALAVDPKLLIFDEALTSIEPELREDLVQWLESLQRERGFACVFITHSAAVADRLGGRRLRIEAGRIVAGRMTAEAAPCAAR